MSISVKIDPVTSQTPVNDKLSPSPDSSILPSDDSFITNINNNNCWYLDPIPEPSNSSLQSSKTHKMLMPVPPLSTRSRRLVKNKSLPPNIKLSETSDCESDATNSPRLHRHLYSQSTMKLASERFREHNPDRDVIISILNDAFDAQATKMAELNTNNKRRLIFVIIGGLILQTTMLLINIFAIR